MTAKTISVHGTEFRIFQGRETKQLDGVTSKKPKPAAWYWEPTSYEGDVTFSQPCASAKAAEKAAVEWSEAMRTVLHLQEKWGVTPDGIVGPHTRKAALKSGVTDGDAEAVRIVSSLSREERLTAFREAARKDG